MKNPTKTTLRNDPTLRRILGMNDRPNLPLAPLTTYGFRGDKVRKYKAVKMTFGNRVDNVQPLGGDGKEVGGWYPVPHVVQETATEVTVKYDGTGMGDPGYEWTAFKTLKAAQKAAAEELKAAGLVALTEEQEKELAKEAAAEELKAARKRVKDKEQELARAKAALAKLEGEQDER